MDRERKRWWQLDQDILSCGPYGRYSERRLDLWWFWERCFGRIGLVLRRGPDDALCERSGLCREWDRRDRYDRLRRHGFGLLLRPDYDAHRRRWRNPDR